MNFIHIHNINLNIKAAPSWMEQISASPTVFLSLCDTAACRKGCWLSLSSLPSPQGSCMVSLLSLCYTRLLSGFLVEISICLVKAQRFCPGSPGDLECASSNLSVFEVQQTEFALLCHKRGVSAPSTESCNSRLLHSKLPCWHLTRHSCPDCCVKRKLRVYNRTEKCFFSTIILFFHICIIYYSLQTPLFVLFRGRYSCLGCEVF